MIRKSLVSLNMVAGTRAELISEALRVACCGNVFISLFGGGLLGVPTCAKVLVLIFFSFSPTLLYGTDEYSDWLDIEFLDLELESLSETDDSSSLEFFCACFFCFVRIRLKSFGLNPSGGAHNGALFLLMIASTVSRGNGEEFEGGERFFIV